jgi:hypothetical protein
MPGNHRLSLRILLVWLVLTAASLSCQLVTGGGQQANPENNDLNQPQLQDEDQAQGEDEALDEDLGGDQDQEDIQDELADFEITGIWESQVDTELGKVSTELLLEPTGTFSQTVRWGDLMTYDTGEYTIIQNAIHFTVTHHEPAEYKGQPMTWVASFTYFVTPIDATSMTVEDHIMNTSWTMYKTGP